jgi:Rad3-related DNA helicase
LELYFSLQDFLRTAERYDTHYVTQLTAAGSELRIELLCLDPSAFVDSALATGRAAALFSATLAPPGYYRGILGCEGARAVALPSPFPPEHLGLYCLPGISTRYRQREASIRPISDALAAMVRAKAGNYLAFFPSYAYLKQVAADFAARYPDIPTLVQESGLDDTQREEFLRRFAPAPSGSLLGFGVLGGVFGEGVDLAGDRLIGCAVVGVGLPQVNPRQEMLRRYFDEKNGCGFDYAYRYPGMNKVLQAAGRVIRTEADKGVVLLLDDRFARAEYRALFPAHWAHLRYLPDTDALQAALADFWREAP